MQQEYYQQQYIQQHLPNYSATSFQPSPHPDGSWSSGAFNPSMGYTTQPSQNPGQANFQYSNSSSVPNQKVSFWRAFFSVGTIEDEGPLLEELGVNFAHMTTKSLAVLNPFSKRIDQHIMDDTDIAGPLFFCLLLGAFLLLSGKIQFGFIYGVGVLGCLSIFFILNLMSDGSGIDSSRTASVLGYCLLPMVLLSGLSIGWDLKDHWIGLTLGIVSILWCTFSACTIFVTILSMRDQRLLIAYPIGLFYTCFAMLTIF
jgi:hypothetical protein